MEDQEITLDMAQKVLGTAASQTVIELVEALINRQADKGLDIIHATLDAGSDPRQYARQIVDYLRDLMLIRMGSAKLVDAGADLGTQMQSHAQSFEIPDLLQVIQAFNNAATRARALWQPSLPLEMAFVEALSVVPTLTEKGDTPVAPNDPGVSLASVSSVFSI